MLGKHKGLVARIGVVLVSVAFILNSLGWMNLSGDSSYPTSHSGGGLGFAPAYLLLGVVGLFFGLFGKRWRSPERRTRENSARQGTRRRR
jgi:hypothetical protein